MKGWKMFAEIKKYKEMGLNKSQVERKLDINYKTVDKYWNMSHEEYASLALQLKSRKKKLEKYETIIIEWLKEFSDISAVQVNDWIKEKYNDFTIKDRTLRDFIQKLREKHKIPKQIEKADLSNMTYQDFLLKVLEEELELRSKKARERRFRSVEFPVIKTIEDFDLNFQPVITQKQINRLLELEWIDRMDNLMYCLKTKEISRNSKWKINRIQSSELVIIDELGYLPITREEANLFFQLVSTLHEQSSLIITSNKGFED